MATEHTLFEQGLIDFQRLLTDSEAPVHKSCFSDRVQHTSWYILDKAGAIVGDLRESLHAPVTSDAPIEHHTLTANLGSYRTGQESLCIGLEVDSLESLAEFDDLLNRIREAADIIPQSQ